MLELSKKGKSPYNQLMHQDISVAQKCNKNKKNVTFTHLLSLALCFSLAFSTLFISGLTSKATGLDQPNLFDKEDNDNWLNALSYLGERLTNTTDYANIFTTHKISVKQGDTIYVGPCGAEEYCMEIYGSNDKFITQVKTADTKSIKTGRKVIGVQNQSVDEIQYSYTFTQANVSYVRIIGNVSLMNNFMVFLNLNDGMNGWPQNYVPFVMNPLSGKSVLFVGDSITNAIKDDENLSGWAGRIGKSNNMNWTNAGISGASVSTVRSSNRIITQIKNHHSTDYDYVILHGGVNDAMDNAPIGKISDSFNPANFDTTTFAGGLEELFYYAGLYYPGAKIGYIVNYATPNSTWGGATRDMGNYFKMAKEVCEKWGVSYIDLYFGTVNVDGKDLSYSYDILKTNTSDNLYNHTSGEVHIGGSGYDVISPYIAEWMKTLKAFRWPPVNKTELQNVISSVNETAENYTKGSYEAYIKAVQAGKEVLNDDDATQDAVDAAVKEIQNAKIALVSTAALNSLLQECQGLTSEKYTQDTWSKFVNAQKVANAVKDSNGTQADVNSAFAALKTARDQLKVRSASSIWKNATTSDKLGDTTSSPLKSVDTGGHIPVAAGVFALVAIGAALAFQRKKKQLI